MNREALKGLSNGIVLSSLVHLSGNLVFVTYAVVIFEKAGASQISPYVSSITIAVMQLVGNLCTTRLSDSLGRKKLLIISLLGTAFGLFSFALYLYLKSREVDVSTFEWIPVISLSFVIFAASAGVVPLMFVCTVEYLPSKVS